MTRTATSTSTGLGRALVAVYGVFALAATARSLVQLATKADEAPLAYALSAVAALVYPAIEWLERAISIGNENYPWFISNPNWDLMREEPRFKAIMENLRERWEKIVESN